MKFFLKIFHKIAHLHSQELLSRINSEVTITLKAKFCLPNLDILTNLRRQTSIGFFNFTSRCKERIDVDVKLKKYAQRTLIIRL